MSAQLVAKIAQAARADGLQLADFQRLEQAILFEQPRYVLELLFLAEGLAKWSQDPMLPEELLTPCQLGFWRCNDVGPLPEALISVPKGLSLGCALQLGFQHAMHFPFCFPDAV
eukprot:2071358-Amphidinium_carterae.3